MRVVNAIAVASLMGLVACGDDGEKQESDSTQIGILVAKTGNLQAQYPLLAGADGLALEQINAEGGVLGKPVTVVEREASPDDGTAIAVGSYHELADLGIQAVVGPIESEAAIAVAGLVSEDRVVMIAPVAGAAAYSDVADDDLAYRLVSSSIGIATAPAQYAYGVGYRRLAILYVGGATSEISKLFGAAFTSAGGEVVYEQQYDFNPSNPNSFDSNAIFQATYATDPDLICLYAAGQDGVALLRSWQTSDYDGHWMLGPTLASGAVAQAAGVAKMAGKQVFTIAVPAQQTLATVLANFQALNGITLDPANASLVLPQYEALLLMALAIEKAGRYDGNAIKAALREVANPPGQQVGCLDYAAAIAAIRAGEDIDYVGLSSPIDFDAFGDVTMNLALLKFDANGNLLVDPSFLPYQ
jgi:ABC-type branched-subunit amino acid transport system substrate-binding protein